MRPALPTHNMKAAAGTNRGDLNFVPTTELPLQKDNSGELLQDHAVRRKAT